MNLIQTLIDTSYHVCIRMHSRARDVEVDEGSFFGHARVQLTVGCSVSVGANTAEMYRLGGTLVVTATGYLWAAEDESVAFS